MIIITFFRENRADLFGQLILGHPDASVLVNAPVSANLLGSHCVNYYKRAQNCREPRDIELKPRKRFISSVSVSSSTGKS